jgi:hypothetical protein
MDRPLLSRERHAADLEGDDVYTLLTVDEMAQIFKVSRTWVCEHVRPRYVRDRLPHIKLGKYVRFEPKKQFATT